MIFKQRFCIAVLVLVLVVAFVGCNRDDDDDGLAPGSVAGQTYQMTPNTVTGIYQPGMLTIAFVGNGYAIRNQAGIPIDTGTYGYNPSDTDPDSATITLTSISGVVTTCTVTYLTKTTGTFTLRSTLNTAEVGTAEGTFVQIEN